MLRIAIVGNIASGKSCVENILKSKGYPVLDSDIVCHNFLTELGEIAQHFRDYDIFEAGKISREKLGKLVFNNSNLKSELENILYPHLILKIEEFFKENFRNNLCFVSVPLLYEAGMENLFDRTIFVYCDDDIRLNRLIIRNGYSIEYAKIRMNSQMSQDKKLKCADFIINNNGTLKDLETNVSKLVEQIR